MRSERRAVLGLIAAGRMTAADALRLEALWSENREWIGVIAVCALVMVVQLLPTMALHAWWGDAIGIFQKMAGGMR